MAREDEIRLIAYNIWQEEGCVDGRDCEQWLRAEIIWSRNDWEKSVEAKSKPQIRVKGKGKKQNKNN